MEINATSCHMGARRKEADLLVELLFGRSPDGTRSRDTSSAISTTLIKFFLVLAIQKASVNGVWRPPNERLRNRYDASRRSVELTMLYSPNP